MLYLWLKIVIYRSEATRSGELRNTIFSVKDKNSCET